MALFVMIGTDHPPHSMPLRDSIRPEHRDYVLGNAGKIRLAGAFVDGQDNQCGTMLVFEADSAEEVWDWIRAEPFYKAGVYADMQVRAWNLVIGAIAPRS